MLFAGTTSGVFAIKITSTHGSAALSTQLLSGCLATHISATKTATKYAVAAAVPTLGPVHKMLPLSNDVSATENNANAGIHIIHLAATPTASSGLPNTAATTTIPAVATSVQHVWKGDARSVAIQPATNRLFVGTEPANVHFSEDLGLTWMEGNAFKDVPSRPNWSFPAPPHLPHTLSFDFVPAIALNNSYPGTPSTTASGSGGSDTSNINNDNDNTTSNSSNTNELLGKIAVLAGVEVGGLMVSTTPPFNSWEERNQGLYPDVHSCRVDPFDPLHWNAVTGRGLYGTYDAGKKWTRLSQGLYPVGLAFNPMKRGEMLMAAGDRPPALGVHVMLSHDGGQTLTDITDTVFGSRTSSSGVAKGKMTPVPYFVDDAAILGTDSGHILVSRDEGREKWEVLCELKGAVVCLAAADQSSSSVMH